MYVKFYAQVPLLKLYQFQFTVSEDVHSDFNSEWNSGKCQENNSFSLQIIASNQKGENVPFPLQIYSKINAEIAGSCLSL